MGSPTKSTKFNNPKKIKNKYTHTRFYLQEIRLGGTVVHPVSPLQGYKTMQSPRKKHFCHKLGVTTLTKNHIKIIPVH